MKALIGVVLAAALLPACGGDSGYTRPEENSCRPIVPVSDSPDPGSGYTDCSALDGYELYFIDTFETGMAQLGWYVNNDRTALQIPAPDEDPPRTSPILSHGTPNGRCLGFTPSEHAATRCASLSDAIGSCTELAPVESRIAMHVQSGNLTGNGGQLGRDFAKSGCTETPCKVPGTNQMIVPGPPEVGPCSIGNGPSIPVEGCHARDDTSNWEGIVFWGRVAPGSTNGIRVRVGDGNTDDKSCSCDPFTKQNDSSAGCDKWGTYFTLGTNYAVVQAPFAEMLQGGWGKKADQLDTSNLFSMGIEWGRGSWDLWIDDVAFYRRVAR